MPLVHHEQCFGCGRTNLFGLLLEAEPAVDGRLTARCFIKQDHQGAEAGSAHEGIVAAALSDAMALACGIDARANRIEIKFTGSAPVGGFLDIEAQGQPVGRGTVSATAQASARGRPVATATGTYQSGYRPASGGYASR
jgi:acyl-coenzyme A thioesterase PaaI-like protein